MFTDLNIALGHMALGHIELGHARRRMPVEKRRLSLCDLVIAGVFCGGVAGVLLFYRVSYLALLLPAALTAVVVVAYGAYCFYRQRYRDGNVGQLCTGGGRRNGRIMSNPAAIASGFGAAANDQRTVPIFSPISVAVPAVKFSLQSIASLPNRTTAVEPSLKRPISSPVA